MTKTYERILYIMIGILLTNLFITIWENMNHLELFLVISSVLIGIILYSELYLLRNNINLLSFSIYMIISLTIIFTMDIFSAGDSIRNFYFIVLYQVFRVYKKFVSLSIYFLITTIHITLSTTNISNTKGKIENITFEAAIFLLVAVIILLVLHLLSQNKQLENMQKDLTLKNLESENTHHRLLKAYNQLEVLTIVKERNKIARDMHDTVGHTLTTALVELEVGKMKLDTNSDAIKKINGATELVRKGLQDLRTSVRTLKDKIDYKKEIEELIEYTTKHTGISIRYKLTGNLQTLKQNVLSCIYRIIQEGLTNGIKHGKATVFIIHVKINEKTLHFNLENNGRGTPVFNKGFGITAMEERVKDLQGNIEFSYGAESGFGIEVKIPLKGEDND